jgi:hypothetical protein
MLVLCQGCLAVSEYTDAKNNDEEFCSCGEQWCGCADCNETAQQLIRGERDPKNLGYLRGAWLVENPDPLRFWCEETGIRSTTKKAEALTPRPKF